MRASGVIESHDGDRNVVGDVTTDASSIKHKFITPEKTHRSRSSSLSHIRDESAENKVIWK